MSHLSPATPDQPPHRVLLLDDQAMIGEAVRRLLAGQPTSCSSSAATWQTALAAAEAFRPTVILQDLIMPGIDGPRDGGLFRGAPGDGRCAGHRALGPEEPTVKAQLLDAGANDYSSSCPTRSN